MIDKTPDTQAIFEWARACVHEAMEEKRNGNLGQLNTLGQNAAFAYYINNVYTTRRMTEDQMAYWHAGHVRELGRLMAKAEQEEDVQEHGERLTRIEAGLDTLTKMVEALVAVQTPKQQKALAEVVEPAQEDDEQTNTDADTDEDEPTKDEEGAEPPADTAAEEDDEPAETEDAA